MIAGILSLALLGAAGAGVEATEKRQTLLYVATSPAGAEVLVDGKRVGTTPGLFPFKPGVRRVIVELEGHDRRRQYVTIHTGDIKRLKLRLKRRTEAEVGSQMLGPNATPDSILARLKKPPKGWEVLDLRDASGDELAKAGDDLGGRIERASLIVLSRHGKRIAVGV